MSNFVLLTEALEHSQYTIEHLRYLVRKGFVQGKKQGGIWLIDLDDLQRYEQEMNKLGPQKFVSRGSDEE